MLFIWGILRHVSHVTSVLTFSDSWFFQLLGSAGRLDRIHDPFRSNSSKEMKELSFLNIPEHQQEQYIV